MNQISKVIVSVFLLTILIVSCMDKEFRIEELREYNILTPDKDTITFFKVPFSSVASILNKYRHIEKDIKYGFFKKKLFELNNGMLLFEKTSDQSYYLLFPSNEEFEKFISGDFYWNVSIHFDQHDNLFSSFSLNPDKSNSFIKVSISSDTSYVKEDANPPVLYFMADGGCCYLTHRINDLYDGYWYSSLKNFEYFYQYVY